MRTKLNELTESVSICSHKIIILTETNLASDVDSSELGIHGYSIYRKDRSSLTSSKESGGGVLIAVRSDIPSMAVRCSISNVELLFVSVNIPGKKLLVGGVYIPPSSNADLYSDFCDATDEVCSSMPADTIVVIAGDFNQPDTDWEAMDRPVSVSSRFLMELAQFQGLTQINTIRNSRGVYLDLVFSSLKDMHVDQSQEELITQENAHPALVFEFVAMSHQLHQPPITLPNLWKCDIDQVYKWIQRQPFPNFQNCISIDEEFTNFCTALRDTIVLNCPLMRINGSGGFPCWFSFELKRLVFKKKKLHKKFKTTLSLQDFNTFQRVRGQCKRLARECHQKYLKTIDEAVKTNPKSFWKYVQSLRGSSSSAKVLSLDDRVATEPFTMCDMFADYFSTIYKTSTIESSTLPGRGDAILFTVQISAIEMEEKLKALDTSKSPGPDGIPANVLKHCSEVIAPHLAIFFNIMMKNGVFPTNLKSGFIIPIHKSGDLTSVKNYRPIVIQSSLAKVFECIVLDRLSFAMKGTIIGEQHGFQPGRSTTTNLLVFTSKVLGAFARGNQLDCVYLDYSKAFDRISHRLLIEKLKAYGVSGSLLQWFHSYLSGRTLQVKYSSTLSKSIVATSGVPQGSHLGPPLFSLYINDIGNFIGENFLLFADDVKLFREVSCVEDQLDLQNTLERVEEWCNANDMDLNPSKSMVITYTRTATRTMHYQYNLYGEDLCRVFRVRDLGVTLTANLDFGDHIENICNQALKTLGLIIRISRQNLSISTLRTLYVALARPILEYSVVVWSPYQANHSSFLDRVQRRFLRMVGVKLGQHYMEVNIMEMERFLCLPSLSARRTLHDLIFLYKVLNSSFDCVEILHQLNFHVPRQTRRHQLFSVLQHSTNYQYYSTLPRLMRAGNYACTELDFFCPRLETFRRSALAFVLRQ